MAIVRRLQTIKRWRGWGEGGSLLHYWWEGKLIQALCRTVRRFLGKLQPGLLYDPVITLLGYYLEKTLIWKDTCTSVYTAALFYNRQDMGAPQVPTDRWMGKDALRLYNTTSLSCKKEPKNAICCAMDGPRVPYRLQSVRKGRWNTAYMWNLEKWYK